MLKRILFIILILLITQVCFAGRLQEMQKAVIAAKNGAGGGGVCSGTPVDVTIQTSGTIDSELREASPTSNYNADGTVQISHYAINDKRNILIKFDLSSITGTIQVNSATIALMRGGIGDGNSGDVYFYRILRNWVGDEVSWNEYSTGNNWSTAGAAYSNSDRDPDISASGTLGINAWTFYDFTAAQLSADIEDMVNVGNNYGWVVVYSTAATERYQQIVTFNDATATSRPKLTINYTPCD